MEYEVIGLKIKDLHKLGKDERDRVSKLLKDHNFICSDETEIISYDINDLDLTDKDFERANLNFFKKFGYYPKIEDS